MLPWWTRINSVLVWHPLYNLSKVFFWCPLLVVPPYLCHLITLVPQYLLWTPADNSWALFLCSLVDNCQTTSLFHRIDLLFCLAPLPTLLKLNSFTRLIPSISFFTPQSVSLFLLTYFFSILISIITLQVLISSGAKAHLQWFPTLIHSPPQTAKTTCQYLSGPEISVVRTNLTNPITPSTVQYVSQTIIILHQPLYLVCMWHMAFGKASVPCSFDTCIKWVRKQCNRLHYAHGMGGTDVVLFAGCCMEMFAYARCTVEIFVLFLFSITDWDWNNNKQKMGP